MDPILEIQGAIITRLRSFADVTAIVAERSFDEPPRDNNGAVTAMLPYSSIGPSNYQSEEIDCITGGEVMIQIDAWSDYPGKTEVRRLAHAVKTALHDYDLPVTENAVVTFQHWRTDYLTDGAIQHASIRFTGIVEEPST
jgi:hypothetical protein